MNLLTQIYCSRVRAEVLRVLFGLRSGESHLRQIQRQTKMSLATVRQDLEKLARLGLIRRRPDGNRVCYSANPIHPLYNEIHRMVLKTVGLVDVLGSALRTDGIRCAFIFGSIASGTEGAESDVDLMVIGEIGLRKLAALLAGVSDSLGREINPHVWSEQEFGKRLREKEHFATSVMASEKIFVIGSEHELETMAG